MSISTNIHGVANISVSDPKPLYGTDSYVREIVMRDDDGKVVAEFNVFADAAEGLDFRISYDPKLRAA